MPLFKGKGKSNQRMESLERLLEEERVAATKPKRPRGRPKGGQNCPRELQQDNVQTGPMDQFVRKSIPQNQSIDIPPQVSINDQDVTDGVDDPNDDLDDPEYDPTQPLRGKSTTQATTSRPIRGRPKKVARYYSSTSDDSDEDNINEDNCINPKHIKIGHYIIWNNNGTHYPALVIKKFRNHCNVQNMLADYNINTPQSRIMNWLDNEKPRLAKAQKTVTEGV